MPFEKIPHMLVTRLVLAAALLMSAAACGGSPPDRLEGKWRSQHGSIAEFVRTGEGTYTGEILESRELNCLPAEIELAAVPGGGYSGTENFYLTAGGVCGAKIGRGTIVLTPAGDGDTFAVTYTPPGGLAAMGCVNCETDTITRIADDDGSPWLWVLLAVVLALVLLLVLLRRRPVTDRALLREISQQAVAQVDPAQSPYFPLIADAYLADPRLALRGPRRPDQVGSGIGGEDPLIIAAAIYVAGAVLEHLIGGATDGLTARIRGLLRRRRRPDITPLTPEQAAHLRQVAAAKGREAGLPDATAGLLADAVVGAFAVPRSDPPPAVEPAPDNEP
jgi:hypothetical protein